MDYLKTLSNVIHDVNHVMKSHPKRLLHIQGVASCMETFSKQHHLNVTKSLIIAYLHDITKKEDDDWHVNHSNPRYLTIFEDYPYYLHALSACYIAKEKYNIEDQSILDALLYHCTGHDDLDIYAKLLIISDVCEPSRKHHDTTLIFNVALKDVEAAYKMAFELKYQMHLKENQKIHPWFKKAKENIEENHVI